jgi:hypothetical protein
MYRVEASGKLQSLSNYTVVAEAGGMLTFFPIKMMSTVQKHLYLNVVQAVGYCSYISLRASLSHVRYNWRTIVFLGHR